MSIKQDISEEPAPGLTFREKSLWATLVSTIAIYVHYFWRVVQIGDGDPVRLGVLFAGTVAVMIAVQVVVHAALAIHRRPERLDERDHRIALRATRIAYYVMMTGVWGALGVAAMSLGTFWLAHTALLAIVLGEVTRSGVQIFYYRRGGLAW